MCSKRGVTRGILPLGAKVRQFLNSGLENRPGGQPTRPATSNRGRHASPRCNASPRGPGHPHSAQPQMKAEGDGTGQCIEFQCDQRPLPQDQRHDAKQHPKCRGQYVKGRSSRRARLWHLNTFGVLRRRHTRNPASSETPPGSARPIDPPTRRAPCKAQDMLVVAQLVSPSGVGIPGRLRPHSYDFVNIAASRQDAPGCPGVFVGKVAQIRHISAKIRRSGCYSALGK